MSILIKNMKMPTSCFDCIESYQYQHSEHLLKWCCRLTGKDIFCGLERDANCPLVELPPHGRLIDADAIMSGVDDGDDVIFVWAITDAPTIIPAEEGE